MFRAIIIIFRRSHYCIHAAYSIITLKTSEWYIVAKYSFTLIRP